MANQAMYTYDVIVNQEDTHIRLIQEPQLLLKCVALAVSGTIG